MVWASISSSKNRRHRSAQCVSISARKRYRGATRTWLTLLEEIPCAEGNECQEIKNGNEEVCQAEGEEDGSQVNGDEEVYAEEEKEVRQPPIFEVLGGEI